MGQITKIGTLLPESKIPQILQIPKIPRFPIPKESRDFPSFGQVGTYYTCMARL